jgi:hypothetical protein
MAGGPSNPNAADAQTEALPRQMGNENAIRRVGISVHAAQGAAVVHASHVLGLSRRATHATAARPCMLDAIVLLSFQSRHSDGHLFEQNERAPFLRGTLSGLPPLRALSKACCGDRVFVLKLERLLNHSTGIPLAFKPAFGSSVTLSAQ